MSYITGTMRKVLFLLAALAALTMPAAVRAAEDGYAGPQPSANPAADIAKAEVYLDGLKTARARFLQTAPDGTQTIGTFYLNRPGRLRFEYDAPVRDFVVADGFFIYFYDGALKEQSNAPIGQTLADFLLRPDLALSGDIQVTEVRRSGGLLILTLAQAKDPAAGSLMLGFEEHPMLLKKWRVIDATGAVVEVELFQMEENIKLPDSLFVYAAPAGDKPRYNQ